MGMAASQARLLTITARLADNELRSQTINNAKMRLATQSAQASDDYVRALNNATYKFTNYDATGAMVNQALTYKAMTTYGPYNTQYGLVNAANQLLVSEAEAIIFDRNKNNLDGYLKEHGLVYDTTYFDRFDKNHVQNLAYPSPWDDLDGVTLKKFYEEYGSYESSIEVETYLKTFTEFERASSDLDAAASLLMKEYVMTNGGTYTDADTGQTRSYTFNVNPINVDNGYELAEMNQSLGLNGMLQLFKNAFLNNNNRYNLNKLNNNGYIYSEAAKDGIKSINGLSYSAANGVSYKENCALTGPVEEEDGTKTYSLDGGEVEITVDANGKAKIKSYEKLKDHVEDSETEFVFTDPGEKNNYIDLINSLSYIEKDKTSGKETRYKYSVEMENGEPKAYCTRYINDTDTLEKILKEKTTQIIESIINSVNSEKYVKAVLNDSNKFFLDVNGDVSKIIIDYTEKENKLLQCIFGDAWKDVADEILAGSTYVEMRDADGNIIKNPDGTDDVRLLTANNLKDVDFVLQYMKQSGRTPSESFETVIKHFLVEDLIDEYGTPKYAWVDEDDKEHNQENADAKAQWYTNLFKRMQQGYKVLEDGLANSKEWIEYALESGTVFMEQVDSSFVWNAIDYKNCTRITEETDDAAVARAEAEYNRAMNDIKTKDSFYDLELKNIDTEHNALQTEYDVIKGVISKNIERNFKFNQSA